MRLHPVFEAALRAANARVRGKRAMDHVAADIAADLQALFESQEAHEMVVAARHATVIDQELRALRLELTTARTLANEMTGNVAMLEAAVRVERQTVSALLRVLEDIARGERPADQLGLEPGVDYWSWIANRRRNLADQALRTFKTRGV